MSIDEYNNFNYNSKDIAIHITKLREKKGLSSYQLSLDSGVNHSVVRRIELFEREPRISTLFKIIDGLGMTPVDFFSKLEK